MQQAQATATAWTPGLRGALPRTRPARASRAPPAAAPPRRPVAQLRREQRQDIRARQPRGRRGSAGRSAAPRPAPRPAPGRLGARLAAGADDALDLTALPGLQLDDALLHGACGGPEAALRGMRAAETWDPKPNPDQLAIHVCQTCICASAGGVRIGVLT